MGDGAARRPPHAPGLPAAASVTCNRASLPLSGPRPFTGLPAPQTLSPRGGPTRTRGAQPRPRCARGGGAHSPCGHTGDRAVARGGLARVRAELSPWKPGLPLSAATRVPVGGGGGCRVTPAAARGPGVCCRDRCGGCPPHSQKLRRARASAPSPVPADSRFRGPAGRQLPSSPETCPRRTRVARGGGG